MNKKILLIALIFPIIVLFGVTVYKHVKVSTGQEIILPITGFDPRDILSGHYLTYRINYGAVTDVCAGTYEKNSRAYACLVRDVGDKENYRSTIHTYSDSDEIENSDCAAIIRGRCNKGRFTADLEKFFIPEANAAPLDRAVRNRQGKIVLSVSSGGNAVIKDLLIDGKSWKEYKD
jgi:uncharacterized membrane-anchored protein